MGGAIAPPAPPLATLLVIIVNVLQTFWSSVGAIDKVGSALIMAPIEPWASARGAGEDHGPPGFSHTSLKLPDFQKFFYF